MPSVTNLGDKRKEQRPPKGEDAPKPPPRQPRQPKADTPPRPTRPTPADRKLAEAVAGMYQVVGATAMGFGLRLEDAGIVGSGAKTIEMAEPLSVAWVDLANKNPAVKAALIRMTEVSSLGVLVGLHITALAPLLVDRGVIPTGVASMMSDAAAADASQNGNGASPVT